MDDEYMINLPYLFTEKYLVEQLKDPRFSSDFIIIIRYYDGGLISNAIFKNQPLKEIGGFYTAHLENVTKGTPIQQNNPFYLFKARFQKVFPHSYEIIVRTILAYEKSHPGTKIQYIIVSHRNHLS
jgi:hypothetical protein